MEALTLETTVRIAPSVVSATVAGEVVILDPDAAKYFGVEGAGVEIWELLREPRRVAELRDRLLEVYEVDPADCEANLIGILEQMRDGGLIEVVER
jgi:hypothetical protein